MLAPALFHAPSPWRWDAALFCVAAALVAAAWLGYSALVYLWARFPKPASPLVAAPPHWPSVTLVVAAHNEAEVIADRLANALALDYPADLLEILVAEDGSTDGTAERARACADPRLCVLSQSARAGKTAALNRAAAVARGDILVFSDANNRYPRDCLRHLLAPFSQPEVGAVAGSKTVAADAGVGGGESVYWRFERWLMRQESRCGSVVNAPGEILALRRECFRPLPTGRLSADDLGLVWSVLAQGRRVAFAPAARSTEWAAASAADEWRRRTRIAGARWRLLREAMPLLGRMPCEARLKIAFHQVLRPLSPLAMAVALASGLPLLLPAARLALPTWMVALAWAQAVFYLLAVAGAALARCGLRIAPLAAAWFFVATQAGNLGGLWAGWRGEVSASWRRVRRAPPPPPRPHAPSAPATVPQLVAEAEVTSRSVVGGLAWAGSSFVLGKLIVFASIMLLARLLAPRDFGEIAIVLTAITFLEIFSRLGLQAALIFEPGDVSAAAAPVFWLTLAASALAAALAWWGAPWVARYFHEPVIRAMLRVLAPSLLLTALGSTHDTLLRRALAFRAKLFPDLGLAGAKGLGSVVLALLHFGAWSLIWGQWMGIAASVLVLWIVVPWRPRRHWDPALTRHLLAYGKHIYVMETSGTILANLDTITIGRMLNASLLGFYNLAFRVPEVLLISVLNIITGVIFPALSRLQADRRALHAALLETIRYSVLLGLPLAVGMALLGRDLIFALYGHPWARSIPVLRVLALYAALRCLTHHFGDAYKAIGRPDILSRLTILWWIVLPPALIAGARWGGIVGVAWGEVAARAVMSGVHFWLLFAVVGVAPRRLWRALAPAFEGCLVLAIVVAAARPAVAHWPPLAAFAALVLLGAASYVLLLAARYRGVLDAAWAVVLDLARGRGQLRAASSTPK